MLTFAFEQQHTTRSIDDNFYKHMQSFKYMLDVRWRSDLEYFKTCFDGLNLVNLLSTLQVYILYKTIHSSLWFMFLI